MTKIFNTISQLRSIPTVRNKILWTLGALAAYRLLVFLPVPFANVEMLRQATAQSGGGLEYFAVLLGGTLDQFSIIAVGLIAYINASIIMQLLTAVVPYFEDLQEQGEQGSQKIQQYTRWASFPLAFLQAMGMIYFMNYLLGGQIVPTDIGTLLLASFTISVGSMILLRLGEIITEKGVGNGTSLIIFSSIVAGITSSVYNYTSTAGTNLLDVILFMVIIVLGLVILCILLVKTRKDIPVVYARQGSVQETASLPIPLNPVGMVPIIFAVAFTTFPYLLSQIVTNMGTQNPSIQAIATWIQANFNIYTQQPGLLVILFYFALIVVFTFFYAVITFNPERMADNIQKRGGFIPGIRPGEETAKYLNSVLMHLCFWGGLGLAFVGAYTYILSYIPFIQQAVQSIGSIPVVVQGSGIVIIVGVIQDLMNKMSSDLLMEKYERI